MLAVNSPVTAVPKIGPKYKKLLENIDISTIEDLLYHFPFRYDDFAQIKLIKDLVEEDRVTVKGVLGPVENIYTKYGKRLTKGKLLDHTGDVDLIWFNQQYLKKSLSTGKNYKISGKVGTFNNKLCFVSPEIELDSGNTINTGRLVPVYPETAGISSKWLRGKIKFILDSQTNLSEFLPEEIIDEFNFQDINEALNEMHFPDSIQEAEDTRKRFAFEELFIELLNVEKRKYEWSKKLKSKKFSSFEKEVKDFIQKLPFKLTGSQKTALDDVISDLKKENPMNRLLEGDVGTGKTVLAIIASYISHLNGFKVLYMAPTEILANQHLKTFEKFLKNTDIKVELRTGSVKEDGDWDILIGTHTLLFNKEKYKNIGLVVIDEQHRFGVEQRSKIVDLIEDKKVPHLLTMTATPIPRTLALTLYGDLSISVLDEFPFEQRKITTKVIPEKMRKETYEMIKERNEPTFIVCPLIEESESSSLENVKAAQVEFENLKNGAFKETTIGLLHGRMKSSEKEEVVRKFRKGEIKILVSTPVIEVGIDIPDATIIVIESAERYGLASLHQLRGRVGRGQKEGLCFTFMSNNSRDSYKRLKALENINEGIKLAEIDLEMRGQGDVFGTEQHGFKKLKVADLHNLEMLENAKVYAQKYFPKLEEYPKLLERLIQRKGYYIGAN